jgi:hypothetical protein
MKKFISWGNSSLLVRNKSRQIRIGNLKNPSLFLIFEKKIASSRHIRIHDNDVLEKEKNDIKRVFDEVSFLSSYPISLPPQ